MTHVTRPNIQAMIDAAVAGIGAPDLSNYYTKAQTDSQIATALANYYTKTQTDTAIAAALTSYYTKTQVDTALAALNLNGLSDVDLTTAPTDGQVLKYVASAGQWKPGTVSGGSGGAGSLTKIIDTTLAADSTAGAVAFSLTSLPATYDDLVFVLVPVVVGNASNNIISLQFNGDTAANYDWTLSSRFEANTSYNQTSAQVAWLGYQTTLEGPIEFTLHNYADAAKVEKHARATNTGAGGGNYFRRNFDACWHPAAAAAINRVDITYSAALKAGSRLMVYGRGGSVGGGAAGQGTAWTVAASWAYSGTAVDHVDFTNLSGNEFMVLMRGVQQDALNSFPLVQVSVDNGATFYTGAADYNNVTQGNGLENTTSGFRCVTTNTTVAKDEIVHLINAGMNGIHKYAFYGGGSNAYCIFDKSTLPITGLRINTGSATIHMIAGSVTILKR